MTNWKDADGCRTIPVPRMKPGPPSLFDRTVAPFWNPIGDTTGCRLIPMLLGPKRVCDFDDMLPEEQPDP